MKLPPAHLENFRIGDQSIGVYVPDAAFIKKQYASGRDLPFPYWSQIWPSALGLCDFIEQNRHYVSNRSVIELGAGLGLPSLLAARYATSVEASDHIGEAMAMMERSVAANGLSNVKCKVMDVTLLPAEMDADVLLLSDINYDPGIFSILHGIIMQFINRGKTVLLSTPHRLMGRPFMEKLLPFSRLQADIDTGAENKTVISVFVLAR